MLPVAPGILAALKGVEVGVVAFAEAMAFIKVAVAEQRDLTPAELDELDVSLDRTDAGWLDALRRKREREAAKRGG